MGFSQTCTVYNQSINFGHRPKGLWMQLDTPTASQHQLAHQQEILAIIVIIWVSFVRKNIAVHQLLVRDTSLTWLCLPLYIPLLILTNPGSFSDQSVPIFPQWFGESIWPVKRRHAQRYHDSQQVCECYTSRSSENCEEREGPFGSGLALWNSPFSPTAALKAPTGTE